MSNINEVLHDIQQKLKAPKNQTNAFGKYKYRSCEDILEAVKPLLPKGFVLLLSDEVVCVGDKNYVKSTVSIDTLYTEDNENTVKSTAYAREAESQKGMNDSQLTGSTSSYARKYALNGLFAIDDTKDSDATNKHDKEEKPHIKITPQTGIATPKQVTMLVKMMFKKAIPEIDILHKYKINSMEEMPFEKVNDCLDFIKKEPEDIPL